jgi:hypothetical protein
VPDAVINYCNYYTITVERITIAPSSGCLENCQYIFVPKSFDAHNLTIPATLGEECKSRSSSLCSFPPPSHHFIPPWLKCSPQYPVLKHLQSKGASDVLINFINISPSKHGRTLHAVDEYRHFSTDFCLFFQDELHEMDDMVKEAIRRADRKDLMIVSAAVAIIAFFFIYVLISLI